MTDGTGLVHLAPAFGPEDLAVGRAYDLPVVNPVEPNGEFASACRSGRRRLLQEGGRTTGRRPWSTRSSVRPRPLPALLSALLAVPHTAALLRAAVVVHPHDGDQGRPARAERSDRHGSPSRSSTGVTATGCENNIDWALSRNRYWGTPLPIWRCANDHHTVVGSRAELAELAGQPAGRHRSAPTIRRRGSCFACPECGEQASRVPEVADVWFDSGCMPFAQWGYPHQQSEEDFRAQYPADYICEAIDQTRGWFYTLMAVGTLVFDESSYRTVLCLGLLLDKEGRKMSKHLGNVLEPIPLMERPWGRCSALVHGRERLAVGCASSQPRSHRGGRPQDLAHVLEHRVVPGALRTAGWVDSNAASAEPWLNARRLDRWLVAAHPTADHDRRHRTRTGSTQRARALRSRRFVDDLSNWYVRRSRRRFWDGDPNALQTLHEALASLTLVMAPLTPFITERVWQDLVRRPRRTAQQTPYTWPTGRRSTPPLVDEQLIEDVALVKRLVELGRAARATSGVKTRQPLSRALVSASGWGRLPDELRDELAAELNVQQIDLLGAAGDEPVDVSAKANFRALGKRFGQHDARGRTSHRGHRPAVMLQQSLLMAGRAEVSRRRRVGDYRA